MYKDYPSIRDIFFCAVVAGAAMWISHYSYSVAPDREIYGKAFDCVDTRDGEKFSFSGSQADVSSGINWMEIKLTDNEGVQRVITHKDTWLKCEEAK